MKFNNITIVLSVFLILISGSVFGTNFTWLGDSSTAWNDPDNWSPIGLPDSLDNITISGNEPSPILSQNRKVNNLTITGDSILLGTYTLTFKGTGTFTSGVITNGTLQGRSTGLATFTGTKIDCIANIICGYIRLSGSTFQYDAYFEDTGVSTGLGAGGCTFNGNVTIKHTGTSTYFTLGNSTGDTFNGNLILINTSTHEINIATSDSSTFNGNIEVNSTNNGGILFGLSGGKSVLASGKTISVGSTGFTNDYLTLKKFTQLGSTSQTLTLTSTGAVNIIDGVFNGGLTVSASGFLLKNNSFYGTSSFTKNGTPNFQSDGGNTFFAATTISNSGSAGRIRMATVTADIYKNNATFNSTGQDLQVAYSGDNYFEGNITINSIKVVFNTATGRVLFTGTNSQSINGSYNFAFKKVTINKNSNYVTANTTFSVDDSLTFIKGIFISTNTNLLTMKAGSSTNGANNLSFVSGPVKKIGSTAFLFPIGKNSTFRKLEITAPSLNTDAFTAEYFDSTQTLGNIMDTTINFISDCGYWSLLRNTGSTNITPKFAFDSTFCDYINAKPAHITFWNGSNWIDKGEGITDGNSKKTSANISSYGNFALSYKLIQGDAPQMPISINNVQTCSPLEILATNSDLWFTFSPDSAMVNVGFFTPDTAKNYASLKQFVIYENYLPGSNPIFIRDYAFDCDSSNQYSKSFATQFDTADTYLIKISRFKMDNCPGIYDSLSYYINMCLMNLRMSAVPQVLTYIDHDELYTKLGNLGNLGTAVSGDIVVPGSQNALINLSLLPIGTLPLRIIEGVTLAGDYDLLSEDINVDINGGTHTILNSSPYGTIVTYDKKGEMPFNTLKENGYMFFMEGNSIVRNLRIEGAMPGYQDHNDEYMECGGINLQYRLNSTNGPFTISHCELYNFSYAGIFAQANTEEVKIENVLLHRVRGGGGGETTKAKGYGIWLQGRNPTNVQDGFRFQILNSNIDECKTGLDLQNNPLNLDVDKTTFGSFFTQETINRHNYTDTYTHPGIPGSPCNYYVSGIPPISIANDFDIIDNASGNVTITNSIFFNNKSVISLPYPVNTNASNFIYNIKINLNTFKSPQTFTGSNNYGGYARISDNFIESCTWDYERITNSTLNVEKILINTPNYHNYQDGDNISASACTGCAQPAIIPTIEFDDVDGEIPGYSLNSASIPYIYEGGDFDLKLTNTVDPLAYIIRVHPNNGSALGNNYSGNNYFNESEIITAPTVGLVTTAFDNPTILDTDKPGLYGIDITAINGSTSSSAYYSSELIHKPFVIVPNQNHLLIFNIKDSYFADLYDNVVLPSGKVSKIVTLNNHIIWSEDVLEGGDGWEQVSIDLIDGEYNSIPIANYIDLSTSKNTIAFSIAFTDPRDVEIYQLRGIKVWIDDVYLKKSDSPENIIKDGGIENSPYGGLNASPSSEEIWYQFNNISSSSCLSLDYKIADAVLAESKAMIGFLDRKSGSKSIVLEVDGMHEGILNCGDYTAFTGQGPNGEMISAAFDFDYRDLINCSEFASGIINSQFESIPGTLTGTVTKTGKNIIIDSDIIINGTLNLEGCQVVILEHTPAWKIIVNSTGTLHIESDGTIPSRLFSCGDMWSGIINNGGNIEIFSNGNSVYRTEISDALTALESDGGLVKLRYINFDNNYNSIFLKESVYDFDAGSLIYGCDFSCSDDQLEKDPVIGQIPFEHIRMENIQSFTFPVGDGTTSGAGKRNNISNSNCGFNFINSKAIVRNNYFERILIPNSSLGCKDCGIAIKVTLGSGSIKIGDNVNLYESNHFTNVNIGIKGGGFQQFGEFIISNNIFNNSTYINPTSVSDFSNTAITLQQFYTTSRINYDALVFANQIVDYRIGIHSRNVFGISIGADINSGTKNEISFNQESFEDYYKGIWLENCNGANVQDNEIQTNNTVTPSGNFTIEGISVNQSVNVLLNLNELTELQTPISIVGLCPNTELHCNNITNNVNSGKGVHLNFAKLPEQGNTGANISWDNIWNGYTGSIKGVTGVVNSQFDWAYDFDSGLNEYNPNPEANLIIPQPLSNNTNDDCLIQLSIPNFDRDQRYSALIVDSILYENYNNEFSYMEKENLFYMINVDTSLLTRSTIKDTLFRQFYTDFSLSNFNYFSRVDSCIVENNLTQANSLNQSIADTNLLEANLKSIYDILINKTLVDSLYSNSDSLILEDIAYQNPLNGGRAVFMARAMLFLEIVDSESEMRMGLNSINSINSINSNIPIPNNKLNFILVPNPATNQCLLSFRGFNKDLLLTIKTSNGQTILNQDISVNANSFLISTQNFIPGIYIVILNDGESILYQKLVINN